MSYYVFIKDTRTKQITEAILAQNSRPIAKKLDQAKVVIVQEGESEQDFRDDQAIKVVRILNVYGDEKEYADYSQEVLQNKNIHNNALTTQVEVVTLLKQIGEGIYIEEYKVKINRGGIWYEKTMTDRDTSEQIAETILAGIGIRYKKAYHISRAYQSYSLGEYLQSVLEQEGDKQVTVTEKQAPERYATHDYVEEVIERVQQTTGGLGGIRDSYVNIKYDSILALRLYWVNPQNLHGVYIIRKIRGKDVYLENIYNENDIPKISLN